MADDPSRPNSPGRDFPSGVFFSVFMLLITGILLILGLLYQQTVLVIFITILTGLGIGTRLWGIKSASGITVSIETDNLRVFPGEPVFLKLHVENKKWLPAAVRIRLPFYRGRAPDDPEAESISDSLVLSGFQKTEYRHQLTPMHRGIYTFDTTHITTSDIFGFFPRSFFQEQSGEWIVYPGIRPVIPFSILKKIMPGKPGHKSPVHDPVYMMGTRDYSGAAPARDIHWKASARYQRLQEKIYAPSEPEKILIVLDGTGFYPAGDIDGFEQTLETIASLAVLLAANNHVLEFWTNCSTGSRSIFGRAGRPWQVVELLECLAGIQMVPAEDMDPFSPNYQRIHAGTSCLYFSRMPVDDVTPARAFLLPMINFAWRPAPKSDLPGRSKRPYLLIQDLLVEE